MIPRLSGRIGITGFALILVLILSAALVSAQSPSPSASPTGQPIPSNAPSIVYFSVNTGQNGPGVVGGGFGNTGGSVFSNNSKVNALLKYCFDGADFSSSTTVTSSPAAASVPPTTTGVSIPAVPGACVLSASTSIVFNNVTPGEHTFSVELVKTDGSSFSPRAYMSTRADVIPAAGGGGGQYGGGTTGNNVDVLLTVVAYNVVLATPGATPGP